VWSRIGSSGLPAWQAEGRLREPKEITEAVQQYKNSEDIMLDFIETNYDRISGTRTLMTKSLTSSLCREGDGRKS